MFTSASKLFIYSEQSADSALPQTEALPSKTRHGLSWKSSRMLLVAYLLVVLGMVALDQTTKFHSEKNFLAWSDPNDVHRIDSSRHRVLNLGISQATASEKALPESSITKNWLDFNLTYVRNTGAAWGIMSTVSEKYRFPFFTLVTLIAMGVIIQLIRSSHAGQRMYHSGLAFIFAGAIGNFADRITVGYVIDWLHFHWKVFGWEYSFPVFNVADVGINVGVGLILLDVILNEIYLKKQNKNSPKIVQAAEAS